MVFPILGANTESAAYEIENSLRFNSSDTARLGKTISGTSNRKTFSMSFWLKKTKISGYGGIFGVGTATSDTGKLQIRIDGSDNLKIEGGSTTYRVTDREFRDVSAWYNIFISFDSTQSTAGNRILIYVNGVQETSFSTSNNPSQDANTPFNEDGKTHYIGTEGDGSSAALDGYLAEFHYIDGTKKAYTDFGEFNSNGVWIPKEYNGSYGTHGFYFQFKQTGTSANSSGMGADTSGNDNHYTPNNLTSTDVTTDTPTNNFMTMNPLFTNSRGTFAEGNLRVATDVQGSVPYGQVEFGGFAVNKGKWYYEAKINSVGSGGQLAIGWNERAEDGGYINGHNNLGSNGNVWYGSSGKFQDGGTSNTTSPDSYTTNDVIGIACDFDNKKFYAHKNGTYQSNGSGTGNPSTGANGFTFNTHYNDYWTPWMSKDDTNYEATVEYNFGNPTFTVSSSEADDNGYGSFEYDVPTGYYSLCTKNLAEFG